MFFLQVYNDNLYDLLDGSRQVEAPSVTILVVATIHNALETCTVHIYIYIYSTKFS